MYTHINLHISKARFESWTPHQESIYTPVVKSLDIRTHAFRNRDDSHAYRNIFEEILFGNYTGIKLARFNRMTKRRLNLPLPPSSPGRNVALTPPGCNSFQQITEFIDSTTLNDSLLSNFHSRLLDLYHFLTCIDKCKYYNEIQSVHHIFTRTKWKKTDKSRKLTLISSTKKGYRIRYIENKQYAGFHKTKAEFHFVQEQNSISRRKKG